jgi:hypothetical protein
MAGKRPAPRIRSEPSSGVPMWLKVTAGLLATLIAAHFYLIYRINQFADGMVQQLGMFAAASHRGGYYTWDGNLGIKRLRIESEVGGTAGLYIQELELDTPGWWWTLQLVNPIESRPSPFGRALGRMSDQRGGAMLPSTDSLHVRLRGFELEINDLLPPGLPDIGFTTGVPFETEGCSNIRYFVPLQLQNDLRLPYQRTDLSIGFAVTGSDQVTVSMQIEAPGLVRSSFEVDWQTDQPRRFLDSDGAGERVRSVRWIIDDHGFNVARNNWCAEQAGVDADEFQRRHITTVRRILEVYGVRMAPETESVYSSFASNGGVLTIEAKWPAEVTAELFAQYPADQKWEVLAPQIWHDNGASTPMALSLVPPRPLPQAFSGSVYDLLARNADAGAAGDVSPLAELGDRMRALGTQQDADAAATPKPAEAAAPRQPSRPQPTPIALDTPSLIAAIGENVSIETDDGRTRTGRLTAVNPETLTIQQRVSGGKADLDFSRERIRKVTANP